MGERGCFIVLSIILFPRFFQNKHVCTFTVRRKQNDEKKKGTQVSLVQGRPVRKVWKVPEAILQKKLHSLHDPNCWDKCKSNQQTRKKILETHKTKHSQAGLIPASSFGPSILKFLVPGCVQCPKSSSSLNTQSPREELPFDQARSMTEITGAQRACLLVQWVT